VSGIITGTSGIPEKDKLSSQNENNDVKRKIIYTITIFHIVVYACAVPIYKFTICKLILNVYKTRNDLGMSIEAYRRSGHVSTLVS